MQQKIIDALRAIYVGASTVAALDSCGERAVLNSIAAIAKRAIELHDEAAAAIDEEEGAA